MASRELVAHVPFGEEEDSVKFPVEEEHESDEEITFEDLIDSVQQTKFRFKFNGLPIPFRRTNENYTSTGVSSIHGTKKHFEVECLNPKMKSEDEESIEEVKTSPVRPVNPEDRASIFSKLTFTWVNKLFALSSEKRKKGEELEQQDMFALRKGEQVDEVAKRFLSDWQAEMDKQTSKNQKPDLSSVLRTALWRRSKGDAFLGVSFACFAALLSLATPILLNTLLSFIGRSFVLSATSNENEDLPFEDTSAFGFLLAAALGLAAVLSGFLRNLSNHMHTRIGFRWRTCIATAVFTHSLALGPAVHHSTGVGAIMNFMQVDADLIEGWGFSIQLLALSFIQLFGNLIVLYVFVDWYAFVGVGSMLALLPVAGVMIALLGTFIMKKMSAADKRTKLTDEMLQSIQGVKMGSWESFFLNSIEALRAKEYKYLRFLVFALASFVSLFEAAPALGAAVAIIFYINAGNFASAPVLFLIISSFNQLKLAFNLIPQLSSGYVNYRVACGRVSKFLSIQPQGREFGDLSTESRQEPEDLANAVELESVTLVWKKVDIGDDSKKKKKQKKGTAQVEDQEKLPTPKVPVFENLTCTFGRGKLTALVGPVGSGKSTLLSAVLGDLLPREGSVKVSKDMNIAYVAQTAWMMNATVRDNILFGNQYDVDRYQSVVKACELEHDLQLLDLGDQTMIGEKGINLSGGQKQRISIARAAYSTRELVVLDDPLSALDPKVAGKVFHQCITGLMRDRTRILVTNQLNFLKSCDSVIVLESNYESEDEIPKDGKSLARLMQQSTLDELERSETGFGNLMSRFNKQSGSGARKAASDGNQVEATEGETNAIQSDDNVDNMMTDEERSRGAVAFRQYVEYWKYAGGGKVLILVIFLIGIAQATVVLNTSWITFWTEAASSNYTQLPPFDYMEELLDTKLSFVPELDDPLTNDTQVLETYYADVTRLYSAAYGLIVALVGITSVFPAFTVQVAALHAARRLHAGLLKSILNAPMSFFDTTPLGRILARFAKDTSELDLNFGAILLNMVLVFGLLISSLFTITSITPYFGAALVPLFVCYWYLLHLYRPVGRDVKRMEAISRSPVYAQFSETLTGLSTVRAYGRAVEFEDENRFRVAYQIRNSYTLRACERWRAFRSESLNFVVVFGAGFFAVQGASAGIINGGLAGLSLTFALNFANFLSIAIVFIAEIELQMNSVERVLYYSNAIPQEAPNTNSPDGKPPKSWPEKGAISVNNLFMKYREDTPLVLKGVSFDANPGERIGVVGRTGSGKSSLMLCFLRLVEPTRNSGEPGPILIDGVDICGLNLDVVRRSISIVPQHPVVFAGSIRMNLDPNDKHSDSEMWESLERCNLKSFVAQNEKGLDMEISDSGGNLSQGQRQLLSLARTVLENSKVLLLDEATSSIDFETDALIQKTLRDSTAFASTTMLVIAHRINTVIDSDRILVLQRGEVAEYAPPQELLNDPSSVFSSMVADHRRG